MKKTTNCPKALLLATTAMLANPANAQAPPDIGVAPVALTEASYIFDTAEQHRIRVDVLVRGLVHPYSLGFLPNGDALLIERGARLRLVRKVTGDSGAVVLVPQAVEGLPPGAVDTAPVGLTDIVVDPAFTTNGFVYFTFNRAYPPDPKAAPAPRPPTSMVLARARFDGTRLLDVKELFAGEVRPTLSGSRIAVGPDSMLYLGNGSPATREAPDLASAYGKVLRIKTDGTIPADNPFVGRKGARPEIYSSGHRDQSGLIVHPVTGAILESEFGPNGGDELNVILPGRNYGWPDYSFGRKYDGPRVSAVPLGPDTEQPLLLWDPSNAPSGLTLYTGTRFPTWTGNLFVGSLRRGEVPRTGSLERIVFNDKLEEIRRESMLGDLHQRIRDVRQGPDGLLYVVTDEEDGALLRISPAP